MRIKILMISDQPANIVADVQLLRDKNFLVYTCFNPDNIHSLIEEIMPDVVFFNPHNLDIFTGNVYHKLVENIFFTGIPVIYTLVEDDVYLVHRKRIAVKDKKRLITDNLLHAVKAALQVPVHGHKLYIPNTFKVPQHNDYNSYARA